ncbi:MAG: peptidylprolyl isomerase [Candidatus Bathyarchaeota archaeon]|nr:peptidylprolyl isomerase [Candidatus Termiticorpusculum sp.]MCL1970892.1 peptidylprolyl isomerase [Candidatus Termiticorpusculum sp.]
MAPKYNRKKQTHHKPNTGKGSSKKSLYIIIAALAIASILIVAYFAGAFNSTSPSGPQTSPTLTTTSTAVPNQTPATSNTKVLLQTSMGNITIQLFDDKPITTQNFLNLVAAGKYDGTVFHRIMKSFMIQGGAINENLPTIKDEIGSNNHNYQYTIAMAKTKAPNSAASGFFINTVDNSGIIYDDGTKFDDTYTAFGKVIEGKDTVDKIANVPVTYSQGELSQPTQTVTLISATLIS